MEMDKKFDRLSSPAESIPSCHCENVDCDDLKKLSSDSLDDEAFLIPKLLSPSPTSSQADIAISSSSRELSDCPTHSPKPLLPTPPVPIFPSADVSPAHSSSSATSSPPSCSLTPHASPPSKAVASPSPSPPPLPSSPPPSAMLPHLYLLERQALQRLFDSLGPSLINPNSRRNTLILEQEEEEERVVKDGENDLSGNSLGQGRMESKEDTSANAAKTNSHILSVDHSTALTESHDIPNASTPAPASSMTLHGNSSVDAQSMPIDTQPDPKDNSIDAAASPLDAQPTDDLPAVPPAETLVLDDPLTESAASSVFVFVDESDVIVHSAYEEIPHDQVVVHESRPSISPVLSVIGVATDAVEGDNEEENEDDDLSPPSSVVLATPEDGVSRVNTSVAFNARSSENIPFIDEMEGSVVHEV